MLRFVLFTILLLAPPPAMADITGKPRVIDGDTIEIAGERIRLHGIDAPEMKQICKNQKGKDIPCGQLAKQALEKLVQGQDVICKGDTRDRYKRLLGVCYVWPFNINEQMVTDGWALAYRKYSRDYVKAETFAKARREGMWCGEFMPPWEWRLR